MKSKLDQIQEIILKLGKMTFADIIIKLEEKTKMEYSTLQKATMFTDVNIDKRFIHLGDNIWDLRANHPYASVHLPINEIYESQKAEEDKKTSKIDKDIKAFVDKK